LKRKRALLRSNSPAIDLPRYAITREGWCGNISPLVIINAIWLKKPFSTGNAKKKKKESEVSQRLTTFALL
jgi:hypothetical protein